MRWQPAHCRLRQSLVKMGILLCIGLLIATSKSSVSSKSQNMKTRKNDNILIIDDDLDIGRMLKLILEHKGFNVIFHENAEQVKEIMQQKEIDVLILDMLLSGVNGTEVCARLKKDPLIKNTPVIMMSAHPDARKTCMNAGADEFMSKPFDMQEMFVKINRSISMYKTVN
jgi:Response regulator containing CheY-like receiver, AAA-type ATPase, and DNA-binding domains